jgi:phage/plasmid primase-like uncharacterized protein
MADASFATHVASFGLVCPGPIRFDKKLHRVSWDPKQKDDDSGWYIGSDHGEIKVVVWGCWREGIKETWTSKSAKASPKLRQKLADAMELATAKAEAAREQAVAERAETAFGIWQNAEPDQPHPYLEKKRIGSEQLRVDDRGSLIVPMRDRDGILKNIQRISADGVKKFFGPSAGLSWQAPLVPADGDLVLCEGVATGATLRKLTGLTVWAALTAGNLSKVAALMRERFPDRRILVAADNDRFEKSGAERPPEKNRGVVDSGKAAKEVGGLLLVPEFPLESKGSDWNDLAAEIGEEEAGAQWRRALKVAELDARLGRLKPAKLDAQADRLIAGYKAAGVKLNSVSLRRRWKEVAGERVVVAGPDPAAAAAEEENATYYDIARQQFLQPDDRGVWMPLSQAQLMTRMKARGVVDSDETPLALSTWIDNVQNTRGVDYAGPIAGHHAGLIEEGKNRYLVTTSPHLIAPEPGEFPLITAVLTRVLDAGSQEQSEFFNGWLSVAVRALYAGGRQPGQCVVLVGPRNCGKSLLQDLVTAALGGRAAKPYRYMAGLTPFNGDLVGAEHLQMGDETPHTDAQTRREFGAQIKQMCVESVQRIEAKYRPGMIVRPFWRLSISLNDEAENLRTLPMLDEHTVDKLMIFKAAMAEMPMPSATNEERAAFWAALMAEMPAYLHFLLREYRVRPELVCQRFGITHFLHPEILAEAKEHEPYMALLDCIDTAFFARSDDMFPVEGTASELEKRLLDSSYVGFEAKKLLSWRGAMGRYLGQIAKDFPERVVPHRTKKSREWVIHPPQPE